MGKADEEGNVLSKHLQFLFCIETSLMCVAVAKNPTRVENVQIVQKVDIAFISARRS